MEQTAEQAVEGADWLARFIVEMGLNLALAAAIIVIGYWVAGRVNRYIVSSSDKNPRIDDTLGRFFGSIAYYVVMAIVGISVLNLLGVQTTSLVALVGAAGLAIGLALQGALSNLAAGVMLIMFRPFKVGQFVEAGGNSGTVKAIDLFTTELTTVDNVQIIVPNGAIWGSPITNYSAHDTRRVDMVFGVSYGANLAEAEQAIRDLIAADARILSEPAAPWVMVTNLGDSSVDFTVRVWCAASDYWALKFEFTRAVKEKFDSIGVDIPFPTTTIVQSGG